MTPQQISDVLGRPLTINKTTLANRIIMGPMAVHQPDPDGAFSDQGLAFFQARAKGGVAMIIVGGVAGPRRAIEESRFPVARLDDDKFIASFKRLADAIHAYNVPVVAEIIPGFGRMGTPYKGRPIISASPINVVAPAGDFMPAMTTPMPEEATLEEIRRTELEMIDAAERMQRAGLDGVEVAAHGSYLGASFLTSRTNWRTDEYGGSVENRARMLVNIFSGIRKRVGADFIVGLRLSTNDHLPDGQGPEEYAATAKLVEAAGADYVAMAPGNYETMGRATYEGEMVDNGEVRIFKEALSVPVFIQGVHKPELGAQAIANGQGDAMMVARSTLADPDYARKVLSGKLDSIVMCIKDGCMACAKRMALDMPIRCVVNPRMGLESRQGRIPPLRRALEAPIEGAVLKMMGSKSLMKIASAFMKH